ncbi:unnamed protein product [Miscanthus lutarioriparius]|uniref:Uncharacterized protein n=1 Tax=Miscanthus lutarioriparius TaxID=422564 RepID=A0A811S019_9POAL|nr:unnamed protein product [Miscanthus lutarioriparius]
MAPPSAPFGDTVVREDFSLAATVFLLLEDLHIGECTLTASMSITSDTRARLKHLRFTDVSLFRLRAPKLAVFEWRCCYADEVRIEAVGRLSDVTIEVDAGRTRTPTPIGTEPKYVTIQQRDKLVTDILQGLMPRL